MIARDRGEKRIEKVVFFLVELRVMDAEHFVEFSARAVHLGGVKVVNDDGK